MSLGGVFEPAKTVHILASTFISNGGGRYMIGLAPDLIVNADGSTTLVGSTSTLAGVEAQVTPAAMLFGYYGAVRIDREVGSDNGKPIGYGIDGSTAANHTIDETTAGVNYSCFRSPQRGALQVIAHHPRDAHALVGAGRHAGVGARPHALPRRALRAAVGPATDCHG